MTWDYADFTHEAKEHGGPDGYIQDIHDGGVAEGFVKGSILGVIATLAVGIGGALIHHGIESKKAKAEAAAAALAEQMSSPSSSALDSPDDGVETQDASHKEADE